MREGEDNAPHKIRGILVVDKSIVWSIVGRNSKDSRLSLSSLSLMGSDSIDGHLSLSWVARKQHGW